MTQEQDLARLTRAVERIADSLERQEQAHTVYVDDRNGYAYNRITSDIETKMKGGRSE